MDRSIFSLVSVADIVGFIEFAVVLVSAPILAKAYWAVKR